jgi:hypothetical protein
MKLGLEWHQKLPVALQPVTSPQAIVASVLPVPVKLCPFRVPCSEIMLRKMKPVRPGT